MKNKNIFIMADNNGKDFTSYLDELYEWDYFKNKSHRHSNSQSLHDMTMYYLNKWGSLKELSITPKQKNNL